MAPRSKPATAQVCRIFQKKNYGNDTLYSTAIGFVTLTVATYIWMLRELKKALEKTAWDATRKNKIYKWYCIKLQAGPSLSVL